MAEDPVTDTKNPLLRTSLAVVTLLSAVVTVALSIGNYFLKQGFDEADRQLKERQQQLEEQFKDLAIPGCSISVQICCFLFNSAYFSGETRSLQ